MIVETTIFQFRLGFVESSVKKFAKLLYLDRES
jgi:hypothetical protein